MDRRIRRESRSHDPLVVEGQPSQELLHPVHRAVLRSLCCGSARDGRHKHTCVMLGADGIGSLVVRGEARSRWRELELRPFAVARRRR
jgi:hypothetical protein